MKNTKKKTTYWPPLLVPVLHFTFFILNFSLPLSLSSVLNFHYSVRRYGRTSMKEGFA